MTIREARCTCGALRLRAESDPVRISIGHCLDCKRCSGSAFAWIASHDAARIAIEGESRMWERRSGMISIPAGVFADVDFPAPAIEV